MTDEQAKDFPVGRRAALGLGAGALAAAAVSAARGAVLDPNKADEARLIQRKMQFRTDSGLVFWWIRGPSFAQVGSELTPLYALNFGSIQRVTQRPDGGFDVKQIECAFRTDLVTGKRLTEFRNPINNQVVPVNFVPVGPSSVHYSRDNIPTVPTDFGGSKVVFKAFHESPFVVGDEIYFRHRARTIVSTPGVPDRLINDISTYSAPVSQAIDPAATWVDAKLQSSDVTGWPRWLNMAGQPGGVTLRGIGGKVRKFADMPPDWLEMLQATRPDIAADPIGALDRPQAVYRN